MAKTIIQNKNIEIMTYLSKIRQHRHLIYTLAKRDIKAKYAQTKLGWLWAIIQPLATLTIFVLFFDKLVHISTGDVPYALFAFCGIITWYLFTYIVNSAGTAIIQNQDLIKKIYFPKIILPISKTIGGVFEFGISFGLLLLLMLVMGQAITLKIIVVPLVLLLVLLTGLSVSIWLSALTVKNRDLQHLIPYLTNFAIWLTPVFYPTTLIPKAFESWIYYLNPLATVLKLLRWALLNDVPPEPIYFVSFIGVFILLVLGFLYFRRIEREIADFV